MAVSLVLCAAPAWATLTRQTDGTVNDDATALVWDACAWGQSASVGTCSGHAAALTWSSALAAAQQANTAAHHGHSDWRVPNRTELASLLRLSSLPAIDTAVFPSASGGFWSSTSYQRLPSQAWGVDFTLGDSLPVVKNTALALRLVRGGLAEGAYAPNPTGALPLPSSPGETGGVQISSVSGGCYFSHPPQFVAPSTVATPLPQGHVHAGDLFAFTLDGCAPGDTATIRITYPQLPANAQYWKHGPTHANPTAHWYPHPATVNAATITFSITNGADGDDDLDANNSQIVDAGGPVILGGAAGPSATAIIPTLSTWALVLLSTLLVALTTLAQRRSVSRKGGW